MTFTVHEPPSPAADRLDRADELKFVKDGFSWMTAIVPPLGFAAKGLWWAVVAYIVFVSAICAGLSALHVSDDVLTFAVLALNVFLGFEASTIERWFLDNKGWSTVGSVNGRSLADCERRFFETWLPVQPVISAARAGFGAETRGWPHGAKA